MARIGGTVARDAVMFSSGQQDTTEGYLHMIACLEHILPNRIPDHGLPEKVDTANDTIRNTLHYVSMDNSAVKAGSHVSFAKLIDDLKVYAQPVIYVCSMCLCMRAYLSPSSTSLLLITKHDVYSLGESKSSATSGVVFIAIR
jgi:hypothetical protein